MSAETPEDGDAESTARVVTDDLPAEFVEPPERTLDDVVGMDDAVETLRVAAVDPLVELDRTARTHGVLVHGPSGTGKTYVAEALAGELAARGFSVVRLGAVFGHGDVRETIADVGALLRRHSPCVLLADPLANATHTEISEAFKEMLGSLDAGGDRVLVAATFSPDNHPYDRCPVFDDFAVKVAVESPGVARREGLFAAFLDDLTADGPAAFEGADLASVADRAEGFSAREVRTACERAVHLALGSDGDGLVSESHLREAVDAVRAETDVGGSRGLGRFSVEEPTSPDVSFDDIGGLREQKRLLREYLSFPEKYGDLYDRLGVSRSRGVLLYGPPGNGKTMLAKAVATEGDRSFFAVSGPELKAPYVGQTERRIRKVFERAREAAPSVVFFDEFDALAPDRSGVGTATYKVDHVNTLLAELDGFDSDADVLVVAATNRRDAIDPAVLRPGRLGDHLRVPKPDAEARRAVVETAVEEYPLADDVTAEWLVGTMPGGVSAATLVGVCEKALHFAVRDADGEDATELAVERDHVRRAVEAFETDRADEDDRSVGFV